MKIDTIWIALIVVLCWSFIGEVFAESPTDVTEEEPEPNDAGGKQNFKVFIKKVLC